jgi:hypothetical protein
MQILVDTLDAVMEPHHALVRRTARESPFGHEYRTYTLNPKLTPYKKGVDEASWTVHEDLAISFTHTFKLFIF